MPSAGEIAGFCFGKVPAAGDFVPGADHVAEAQALDRWFEAGLERSRVLLGETFAARFDGLEETRFLWVGAGQDPVLCGCFGPSLDAAGRRYPFAVGLRIAKVVPGERQALPLAARTFLAAASRFRQDGWRGLGPAEIAAATRTLPLAVDLAAGAAATAAALAAADSDAALCGESQHGAEVLQDLALAADGPPPRYCLRWRSAVDDTAVAFWLGVGARLAPRTPQLWFWPRTSGPAATLRLLLGPLEPKAFPGMCWAELDDDSAFDLGRSGDPVRQQSATQRFAGMLTASSQWAALQCLAPGGR